MMDLRSDTVTRPSLEMRESMFNAEVGDDMFGEDPTVRALEEKSAALFGMEAGLYCSSGTQTNQIAIKVHTVPGDEVICSKDAHIYHYEGGGIAMNSGASVRLLDGDQGRFSLESVRLNVNADDQHHPVSKLVCLEDTCNRGGGAIWDLDEIKQISKFCRAEGIGIHLDGARLFNSLVETNADWQEYASRFDSISICLSKGLGAPVGSVLLGTKSFIAQARRVRKVFGGAMRQAGIIAAAGIYALENNVNRLRIDHRHAKRTAEVLSDLDYVEAVIPVSTNIVIFDLRDEKRCQDFVHQLGENGIFTFAIAPKTVRFVFHLEISPSDVDQLCETLKKLNI